jgi:hypothetical protein
MIGQLHEEDYPTHSPTQARRFVVGHPKVHDCLYVHKPLPTPSMILSEKAAATELVDRKDKLVRLFHFLGVGLAVVAVALQLNYI